MKMNSVVKLCTLTAAICAANVSYAAGSKTANVAISANVVGSCTITATPVNFGSYDANSAVDTFSTGTITLICVKGSQPTVSLSKGLSPNGAQRRMVNAVTGDFLNYGLYKPANTSPEDLPNTACATTETAVNNWDEDKPSRLHPPIAATADPATYNICGAIPKEQTTVSTGDYTDMASLSIRIELAKRKRMTIREYCNANVICCEPDAPISEVAALMRKHHVGDVVVVANQQEGQQVPLGILTDRDILVETIALDVEARLFTASDLMSSPVTTVLEDAGLTEALGVMRGKRIRRLPVVNRAGGLVGMVTTDDLLDLLAAELSMLAGLVVEQPIKEERTRK